MKYLQNNILRRFDILRQSSITLSTANHSEKVVVLCPGQSSQYVGMMKNIANSNKIKEMVETANKILGYDIVKLCHRGPDEILSRTIHCQPAVVIATLLGFEILKENVKANTGDDLKVDSIAGYSVGEISALYMSGRMNYEEAIILLKERAGAMDYASSFISSGMVSIQGLSFDDTRQMCEDLNSVRNDTSHQLSVAIEQYPNAVSIGGSLDILNNVMNREHPLLRDTDKVKLGMVNVSGAFHTNYMLPAQEQLDNILCKVTIVPSNVSLYSNVTGMLYGNDNLCEDGNIHEKDNIHKKENIWEVDNIRELLVRQIVEPVLWNSIMENIKRESERTPMKLYEIGPGKQLKTILSKIDRKLVRRLENILM